MKRSQFRLWLTERLIGQRRVTLLGILTMAGIGLAAILLEFWVIWAIIRIGFISNGPVSFLLTLAIVGGVLAWLWVQTPKRIGGALHTVDINGAEVTLRVAPAMGPVWTYAVGALETDRSFAERLLGFLSLPQRMICTTWQLWQRYQRLQLLDVEACAKVLRLLFRKSERVEVAQIAEECKLDNLPETLYDLSLLDGVVFLTRNGVGLSLANRLTEDVSKWWNRHGGGEAEQEFGD